MVFVLVMLIKSSIDCAVPVNKIVAKTFEPRAEDWAVAASIPGRNYPIMDV